MSIQVHKSLPIKGCSLWLLENDKPVTSTPQADNISITIPSIEFETTDIGIMGTVSIPDFSRVGNLQLTATIAIDNPDSRVLKRVGHQSWMIRYCTSSMNVNTGLEELSSYTIKASGYITSIPNAEVNQGAENTGDIVMNLMSFQKLHDTDVEINIDRMAGKLEISGINYASEISSLY